jgi:serine/threonine protein kinase
MEDARASVVASAGDDSDADFLASARGDEPSTSAPAGPREPADSDDEDARHLRRLVRGGWVPPTGPKHTHYETSSRRLGGGAFGEVLAGRRVADGTPVALKRVPVRDPARGVPDNLLRELKTMQLLATSATSSKSPNVVELLDFYPKGNALVLVLELCAGGDLGALLGVAPRASGPSVACAKSVAAQILLGVAACHAMRVAHRDVKPGNVLVAADGTLKLADFGLARVMPRDEPSEVDEPSEELLTASEGEAQSPSRKNADGTMTGAVQTRWYRAPEILFGATTYGAAVDVWSVGAILGELLSPDGPILQGETDVDQLAKTLGMFGTPGDNLWPDARRLPDYGKIEFAPREPISHADALPRNAEPKNKNGERLGTALFFKLCALDPDKRPSAQDALRDPYFSEEPSALSPAEAVRELRALRERRATPERAPAPNQRNSHSSPDRRDVPAGVRLLTDPELREALTNLGLDEELKALETSHP